MPLKSWFWINTKEFVWNGYLNNITYSGHRVITYLCSFKFKLRTHLHCHNSSRSPVVDFWKKYSLAVASQGFASLWVCFITAESSDLAFQEMYCFYTSRQMEWLCYFLFGELTLACFFIYWCCPVSICGMPIPQSRNPTTFLKTRSGRQENWRA